MAAPDVRAFVSQEPPFLTCPSDTSATITTDCWYWDDTPVAVTNYKGSIGSTGMSDGNNKMDTVPPGFGLTPDCHNSAETNGLFGRNTSVRPIELKHVTDGQSNTIMVGENVISQDYHSMAYFADGDFATCGIPLNYFVIGLDVNDMKLNHWREGAASRATTRAAPHLRWAMARLTSSAKASTKRFTWAWRRARAMRQSAFRNWIS